MLWASFFHKTSTILSHKSDIRNTNILWAIWIFVRKSLASAYSLTSAYFWIPCQSVTCRGRCGDFFWRLKGKSGKGWRMTLHRQHPYQRPKEKFILIFNLVRSYTTNGNSSYLTVSLNSLENLCFLLCLEKVWNLPSVEYHADVFHEGFVLNLKVSEQEHNLKISR